MAYGALIGKKETNVVLKMNISEMKKGQGSVKILRALPPRTGYRGSGHPHGQLQRSYYNERDLSRGRWTKEKDLRIGQYLATGDGWEKITGIRVIGRKHTFDVQISNTHNFVGNGIVAHNTYLQGSGTTTGFTLRTADGNGVDKMVVTDGGNVGVGTTAPSSQLSVGASSQRNTEYWSGSPNPSIVL